MNPGIAFDISHAEPTYTFDFYPHWALVSPTGAGPGSVPGLGAEPTYTFELRPHWVYEWHRRRLME
ncbi:hypothetical protein GCM10008960_09550 [Deinococcus sedimenti]|uniref:Uncharacterized protein n=1 Tax=Deinococcus sedimenti TaxID=1867090 RepID=A0ABQ2S396_9DEIO|nr:hypothetical protein GCM10008960_09550 [Deinococcus sedimenti]